MLLKKTLSFNLPLLVTIVAVAAGILTPASPPQAAVFTRNSFSGNHKTLCLGAFSTSRDQIYRELFPSNGIPSVAATIGRGLQILMHAPVSSQADRATLLRLILNGISEEFGFSGWRVAEKRGIGGPFENGTLLWVGTGGHFIALTADGTCYIGHEKTINLAVWNILGGQVDLTEWDGWANRRIVEAR